MAYRRAARYLRRFKRSYRRRNFRPNWRTVAQSAWWMAKKACSLVNSEYKYVDTVSSVASSVTSSGTVVHLTNIGEGDDVTSRSGRSILPKTWFLRGEIAYNSAGSAAQQVRVVVFRDMNDNDEVAPTVAQLFQSTTAGLGVISPLQKDNSMRFKVLFDKIYNVDATRSQVGIKTFHRIPLGIDPHGNPTQGIHTTYSGTGGPNTAKNHIYMIVISNTSSNHPTLTYYNRLTFIDN